jgi:hypothetical protein
MLIPIKAAANLKAAISDNLEALSLLTPQQLLSNLVIKNSAI